MNKIILIYIMLMSQLNAYNLLNNRECFISAQNGSITLQDPKNLCPETALLESMYKNILTLNNSELTNNGNVDYIFKYDNGGLLNIFNQKPLLLKNTLDDKEMVYAFKLKTLKKEYFSYINNQKIKFREKIYHYFMLYQDFTPVFGQKTANYILLKMYNDKIYQEKLDFLIDNRSLLNNAYLYKDLNRD